MLTTGKVLLRRRTTEHPHGSQPCVEKEAPRLPLVERRHHGPLWKSFIITPATFAYAALLLAVIAGLELFKNMSDRSNGFPAPQSEAVQTFDKFIPIVVLLFVQWIWQMYDLEIKKLAPWIDMRKRPQWAEDSLLLDYVGADPFSIAYQTVGKRHWPVLLSLAGSSLISLCIIVATSLWTIVPWTMPVQDISLQRTAALTNGNFTSPNNTAYMPQYISDVVFKRSPPKWISNRLAITPFEAKQNTDSELSGHISATTDAYSGSLTCQSVKVTRGKWLERDIPDGSVTFPAMTYQVNVSWAQNCSSLVDMYTYPKRLYENPGKYDQVLGNILDFAGRTYPLHCGDTTATAILFTHFAGATGANKTVGITCSPVYTRHEILATVTPLLASVNETRRSEKVKLPGGENLLRWIEESNIRFVEMGNEYGEWFPGWYWDDKTKWVDVGDIELGTWGHLISRVHSFTKEDLTNTTQLAIASKDVFAKLFPYIAQAGYITKLNTTESFTGSLVSVENRLMATNTSIRILQSALVIVVFITGLLFLLHPRTDLSKDPGPLANTAIILADNPELEDQFKNTSHMSEERLRAHLKGVYFRTKSDGGVTAVVPGGTLTDTTEMVASKDEPWSPVFLHPIIKAFLVLLVGACIATLEVLLQLSEKNGGLADADSFSRWDRYSWIYAAPSILFLLGLAVKALHSVVRATYPYAQMKLDSQPPRNLFFNPLFHGPYTVIPRSIRRKMYPIALSALALLTVPAAKIVVAGVFKNAETRVYSSLRPSMQSYFGTAFTRDGKTDGVAAEFALTTLTNWGKIRRPDWTTTTHAIGAINYNPPHRGTTLRAQLPVAFADLTNCRVAESELDLDEENHIQSIIVDSDCGNLEDLAINPNTSYFAYVSNNDTCPSIYFAYGHKLPNQTDYNLTVLECEPTMATSTARVTVSMNSSSIVNITNVEGDNKKDRKPVAAPYRMATAPVFQSRTDDPEAPLMIDPSPNVNFNLFFEIMTRTRDGDPSDYLDRTNLESLVKEGWRSYGSLYAHRALRIPFGKATRIDADLSYLLVRVLVNPIPTRILEAILALLLLLIVTVGLYTPRTDVLRKPPFSVGARMSLLAGSNIVAMLRHAPQDEPPETTLKGAFVKIGGDRTRPNWYGIDIDAHAASFDEQGVDEKGGYLDPWSPEQLYFDGEGKQDESDEKTGERWYTSGSSKNGNIDGDRDPLLRNALGV